MNKTEQEKIKFKGEYFNYTIILNKIPAEYKIVESDLTEFLPYKIGDKYIATKTITNNEYREEIDSFKYIYSWYITSVKMKKKQKSVIQISYTTPHYFSTIFINKDNSNLMVEDPALTYLTYNNESGENFVSDKLFLYLLNTIYSNKENPIKKLDIQLTANVIDQEYLKILSINYKKRGINYFWHYNNLNAQDLNNLIIKISPFYSYKTINPYNFIFFPEKVQSDKQTYYEIDRSNNTLTLNYIGDKAELIVKGIKFSLLFSKNKYGKYIFNQPLEIELILADNPEFNNPTIIKKKYSERKIESEINKKLSLDILNKEGIKSKYIKIKFLFPSHKADIIKISDIQVLE
jgi:hypothetical protein